MIRWHPSGRFGAALMLALTSVLGSAAPGIAQTAAPPGAFGSPPSGEIPILFNDQHVYAKPDTLRANRVLAALVRNGVILVPLRSMFEQLGATVSWDEATHTADVSKPGSDVKVTLGKPVVVVNGEDRPLDVAPAMYRGTVVVPVRVISEAMGAYVQWIPDRRVVVVRMLAAPVPPPATPGPVPTNPTTPVATAAPVPPPTPSPTPSPRPVVHETFVAGDYLISPKVYNEISPGNTATGSYALRGAVEFPLFGIPAMLEGDYRHYRYPHTAKQIVSACAPGTPGLTGCGTVVGNAVYQTGICPSTTDPGCVTVVGFQQIIAFNGLGQAYVPALTAQENEGDVRLGFKIFDPRVYVGAGYLTKSYDYLGLPRLSGAGFGISKLPDLDQTLSLEGSVWYYPR
ncbi:MAG TPA: copper amine oxidase N-terminal domain-containing protein, partial [Xanthomonadales bacterium]|nr:copper amine oxidase N-terminal domain-containing protein [Xanthomonadales bacterium]